jgi:hypothetical protein
MNEEQKINITKKGEYSNINLSDITPENNFIIVEKVFPDGRQVKSNFTYPDGKAMFNYSCKVKYNGTECTFFLKEKEHAIYKELGGAGDRVKIYRNEVTKVNPKTKVKMIVGELKFEKVE